MLHGIIVDHAHGQTAHRKCYLPCSCALFDGLQKTLLSVRVHSPRSKTNHYLLCELEADVVRDILLVQLSYSY